MAKTTKKTTAKNLTKFNQMPRMKNLLGIAFLVGLLAVFPWLISQEGSVTFQALQVTVAILLAFTGGACLGMQLSSRK